MTYLERVLRQQKEVAERKKLRDAEQMVCSVVLEVCGCRATTVSLNGRDVHLFVADEYEADLRVTLVGEEEELEGDARRDVLFALVKEVG